MANSKIDNQLDRMMYLMEYNNKTPKGEKSNIEYHTVAADGKAYGIIKEGNMYYIKFADADKATLKESYDYINGYNYRRENAYKSYNEATKHLELKLMSINEAYQKHSDVTIANTKKTEEAFSMLTEDARKELNRINQIFENSQMIGKNNVGDPESKGKATDPTKQGAPFEEKAEASLDKDPKFNGTVDGATPDNKKVGDANADLTSDKNKTANSGSEKDYTDAHDDLEGDGVADKKPAGGKAVMVNESMFDETDTFTEDDLEMSDFNAEPVDSTEPDLAGFDEEPVDAPVDTDITPDEFGGEETVEAPVDGEVSDFEGDDLDTLLEELENDMAGMVQGGEGVVSESESAITGPDEVLDGGHEGDGSDAEWERIGESADTEVKGESEEAMKGPNGSLDAQTWDKLEETVNRITREVYQQLKEEKTRLNDFGKHPRYQKPAFQTPDNKEVNKPGVKGDWNDESAKGSEPYGKKIGSSAPFEELVDVLTERAFKAIKNGGLKKK